MNKNYLKTLNEIKEKIRSAQYNSLKVVNKELIGLYWYIGSKIVEQQEKHGWGKSVVENLSRDLQKEYPGIRGFSLANLWNMRKFYILYKDNKKLQPLVGEISWVHNIVIMEKCKDEIEREFYLLQVKKFWWSKNVLINKIENKSYENFIINQTNFDNTVPDKYKMQAKLAVKDEYIFDFLELGDEHSEKELEKGLIDKIKNFLIEVGDYFCFVGSQYRLEVENKEYFIDLLLFHRKLRCLIAVELKIGEFIPEYIGKMQFYLSILDEKKRLYDENPSIGLIICKDKNRTTVDYALRDLNKPIGVSTYKLLNKLPKNISKYLPSKEEIVKGLI